MIQYIEGDLLNAGLQAWGHGVNLDGVMGSGIAKQVKREYPEVFAEYQLGCHSGLLEPGGFQVVEADDGTFVYNLVSQIQQGPNAQYHLLFTSVVGALKDAEDKNLTEFGLPLIGCGIGGLDWARVEWYLERLSNIFTKTRILVCTI